MSRIEASGCAQKGKHGRGIRAGILILLAVLLMMGTTSAVTEPIGTVGYLIASDNFEGGNINNWTTTVGGFTIDSTNPHTGIYGMRSTVTESTSFFNVNNFSSGVVYTIWFYITSPSFGDFNLCLTADGTTLNTYCFNYHPAGSDNNNMDIIVTINGITTRVANLVAPPISANVWTKATIYRDTYGNMKMMVNSTSGSAVLYASDTTFMSSMQLTVRGYYTIYIDDFTANQLTSNVIISCPIGWCYVASNYTQNITLLALGNNFTNTTIQGKFNSSSQKYENHRTGYAFNENVSVQQKEGLYMYFATAQDVIMTPGSTPSITLRTGWNLVGNYGTSARTISALKTSIGVSAMQAQYYNKTTKVWVSTDSQSVPAMETFFVYVTSQTDWSG